MLYKELYDIIVSLRAEVEAYKKAKQENDERFMIERAEARAEVGRLSEIVVRNDWRRGRIRQLEKAVEWATSAEAECSDKVKDELRRKAKEG